MMDKYELLNQLGDGTFGCVIKALCKKTGQMVAIKKMKQKFYTWDECVKLPEVAVVRHIHGHPNVVKLREVIRENNQLFLVLEYMEGDLLGVIRKAKQMQNAAAASAATAPAVGYPKIKSYMFQILQSLAYLHHRGYFHRDLKPENLLIKKDTASSSQEVVKLADFGLVKATRARPPFTDYVSTRWYRSPELLLQDKAYGPPVDIWAAGCILAELITTRPLFPGSNEVDQLQKIMGILGSPNEHLWPDGMNLARKIRYTFPTVKGIGLDRVLPPHIPPQALDLITLMLTYDPKKRPTARQCLQHPYFNVGLDEGTFAPLGAAKLLANTAKKYASGPQSAPSGSLLPEITGGMKRTSIGATAAHPKQNGVNITAALVPQQMLCTSELPVSMKQQTHTDTKPQEQPSLTPLKVSSMPFSSLATLSTSKMPNDVVTNHSTLTGTKKNGTKSTDEVDLDGLMNEFADELETLGLFSQPKQTGALPLAGTSKNDSNNDTASSRQAGATAIKSNASPMEPGLIANLLNSTRYKRSSFDKSSEHGTPLQSRRTSVKVGESIPLQVSSVGGKPSVSPSILALLARHKNESLSSVFK